MFRGYYLAIALCFMQLWCQLSEDHKIKKSNAITGLDRPLGYQEVEAPRFLDSRHMKVVRLSALRTGRLYRS
jgi:hypothetical protein